MRSLEFIILISLCIVSTLQDEDNTKPEFMERLVKSIPDIPGVIKGQLQGSSDELKKLMSNMFGEGLLSQLVVSPLGIASNFGNQFDIGLNQTENSKSPESRNKTAINFELLNSLISSTAAPTTTTKKVMYVDGVPIKNFDDFIRKHNLESKGYTTREPPTTTTQISSDKVAEAVLERLKTHEAFNPKVNPTISPNFDNIENTMNIDSLDLRKIPEMNSMLRRSPEKLVPANIWQSSIGPPGIAEPIRQNRLNVPKLDEVSVEDIKNLQKILQSYEENIQTKELLTRRKQLQELQSELAEQRRMINFEKQKEIELRKKEKELEEEKAKMEQQLKEQLYNWHTAFEDPNYRLHERKNIIESEKEEGHDEHIGSFILNKGSSDENLKTNERDVKREEDDTPTSTSIVQENSTTPPSTNILPNIDDDEKISIPDQCSCQPVDIDILQGKWYLALASSKMFNAFRNMKYRSSDVSCTRFQVSGAKKSPYAQESEFTWAVKNKSSRSWNTNNGRLLSLDGKVISAKFENENLNLPLCIIKKDDNLSSYQYLLLSEVETGCRNVALLVRNPSSFFDSENKEMQVYLRNRIAQRAISAINAVPMAECV